MSTGAPRTAEDSSPSEGKRKRKRGQKGKGKGKGAIVNCPAERGVAADRGRQDALAGSTPLKAAPAAELGVMWQRTGGRKGRRTNRPANQLPLYGFTTMAFTKTIPILRSLDEAKAKEFYVDFLGFQIDWEHRAEGPLYMQVSLGECVLHLSEHSGDCCPGAAVKLHTDNIEEYVAELVAKEYPPGVAEQDLGVCEQPWGSLDMVLIDPFGNRLIFTNARIRRS
jgi:catechol 2,3-dioxygenase-like lactoylglutathione lyase family enzyme